MPIGRNGYFWDVFAIRKRSALRQVGCQSRHTANTPLGRNRARNWAVGGTSGFGGRAAKADAPPNNSSLDRLGKLQRVLIANWPWLTGISTAFLG